MDAARAHADLTVQDVWLRYVSLGGTDDAFELDGYLQGMVPLDAFQQDVLAQALNESLAEVCEGFRIPLSTPTRDTDDEDRLHRLVERLLRPPSPEPPPGDAASRQDPP